MTRFTRSSLSRLLAGLSLVLLALLPATRASAEVGDYDIIDAGLNFLFPFGADNPVTPAQRSGPYPLLSNPSGFNDGYVENDWLAWQAVQLHPDTGAVCGNGSPYRFFINRVPTTTNFIIYFEGGGACWDYESCTGGARLGARNPNGIPNDYVTDTDFSTGLVSPFTFRLNPFSSVKTQAWNIVYVPYCTGDLYTGDEVAVYEKADGSDSIVWHHNGLRNVRAIIAWLKDNLPRPGQTLVTGCSAGGGGTLANYAHLRADLEPTRGFMLNDSGPIYMTPEDGDPALYPSVPLHARVRTTWGVDGGPSEELSRRLGAFDPGNLGSINRALALQFPADRFGHTHFLLDRNYSRYSYEPYYDDLINAPSRDAQIPGLLNRWGRDSVNLAIELVGNANFGVYYPFMRRLNEDHCTTIVEFANADIQDQGLELEDFISSILDGSGAVISAYEFDGSNDIAKPENPLYIAIDSQL